MPCPLRQPLRVSDGCNQRRLHAGVVCIIVQTYFTSDTWGIASMPFKTGESGNPTGKARGYAQMARRLEDMTPRALTRLSKLVESENEAVSLAACKDILDRSLGKAKQNVAVAVTHSLADMHLAALRALSERARIAQAVTIEGDVVQTAELAHD